MTALGRDIGSTRTINQKPAGRPSEHPAGDAAASAAIRGLFGRDSIYLLLWAAQLATAALFTPLTTRILGAARFGLVAASIAVMQVLVVVAGLSMQTAVQRRYAAPGGPSDARRLLTLVMTTSLLVFVLADVTGPIWAPRLGFPGYPLAVRLAVSWAALMAVSNVALGLLRSRDLLIPFATVSLLQSVAAVALSLLLLLTIHRSAAVYLLGQVVAQSIAVGVAIAITRPLPIRRRDLAMVADALHYAIPLVPGALATFVLDASDRLVLQHNLGSIAVARYAVAYNIGSIPILLLGALSTIWMPRVFGLGSSQLQDSVLRRSRNALYALLIPIVAGLAIGAPLLLHIWAPPSYRPDKLLLVVSLVSVSSFAVAGATSAVRVLLANGRTIPVAAATVFAACVNLALNIALVPPLGIEGSALATLLSFIVFHLSLLPVTAGLHSPKRMPSAIELEVLATVAFAIGAAWLPVTPAFFAMRLLITLACIALFISMVTTLAGVFDQFHWRPLATWLRSRVAPESS